jgi:signal transduction histidine kinase
MQRQPLAGEAGHAAAVQSSEEFFGKPQFLLGEDSVRPPLSTLDELLRIRDDERKRLGQELHDCAGHLLVSLQFSIGRLRSIAEDSGQGGLVDEIGEIIGQIDREIRSLAFMEQPVELRDHDVFSAIRSLVFGFARRTGIHTSFKCVGDSPHVDTPVSVALLRIAQEALVNIHRHSRATGARVRLQSNPDQIRLTISDNGVGMPVGDTEAPQGVGLQGMRYRVEILGGRFRTSNLKHGAKICAIVPLHGHVEFAA